jgi:hypothetical protein
MCYKVRANEAKGQIYPLVFMEISIKMQACKPGSVLLLRAAVTIYLGRRSHVGSIDLPFLRSFGAARARPFAGFI